MMDEALRTGAIASALPGGFEGRNNSPIHLFILWKVVRDLLPSSGAPFLRPSGTTAAASGPLSRMMFRVISGARFRRDRGQVLKDWPNSSD